MACTPFPDTSERRSLSESSSDGQSGPSPESFAALGLGPELLADLARIGFELPTPIQAKAIPVVLSGKDVIGIAQTGTGKTAAFVLPILERLTRDSGLAALVLSPTRELAEQTWNCALTMGQTKGIGAAFIIGGEGYREQNESLRDRPGLVVGTPGRIMDQMQRKNLPTDDIHYVVLDEADRLLDMGFAPQIQEIFRWLPKERQTLLFSATMPPRVQSLTRLYQHEPVEVSVGPKHQAVDTCVQELYVVTEREKGLLARYLVHHEEGPVLVFTRTRRGADQLYRSLRKTGHSVTVLHADRTQEERRRAMEDFRSGNKRVLVATDIASRGLDVEGIARVINYDVPPTGEDYLHRIGRTARASRTGHASTLATIEDLGALRSIEAGLQKKIPSVVIPRDDLNSFARDEAGREYDHAERSPERDDSHEPRRGPPRGGGGGGGGDGRGGRRGRGRSSPGRARR